MIDLTRRHAPLSFAAMVLGASLLVFPALSSSAFANSPPARQPAIRVFSAWIRWLPAEVPAAGYLTLTNTGDKELTLEAASSPSYGDVSIHRSVIHGSTEEMTPVKALTIAPHQTLEFQSTGYHLMLMRPSASAETSSKIRITLKFSDGSVLTVPFEVRKTPAAGSTP